MLERDPGFKFGLKYSPLTSEDTNNGHFECQ